MRALNDVLARATSAVSEHYFLLPVAGLEDPAYRERVYCYELYHQMRSAWPIDDRHTLAGETDKSGHPLIRGNNLDRTKPDLLVHLPGEMESNAAAIEVKPITAQAKGIRKDIQTLQAFMEYAEYERGILLVFGLPTDGGIERFRRLFEGLRPALELWHHSRWGFPAVRVV